MKQAHNSKYNVKRLSECADDDRISCDPSYTVTSLSGLISAHSLGAIDIEKELWFGTKESYRYASKDAPVIVRK